MQSAPSNSSLRRRVKAAVRKGVGSNPTPVTFAELALLNVCSKYKALYRSLGRHRMSAFLRHATSSRMEMCNRGDVRQRLCFIGCRVLFFLPPSDHVVCRGMRRYAHPQSPLTTAHVNALTLSTTHLLSHIPYMPRCTTPATFTPTTCSCNPEPPEA